MSVFRITEQKLRVTLLVLPDSSMMSLASALDTMRAANRIADRTLFEWKLVTLNGKPAHLTCGLPIEPDAALDDSLRGDLLIIIAGFHQQRHAGPAHWEDLEDFANHFPEVRLKSDRFVIDGKFFTTGGASPTFDFMLYLIRMRYGYPLAIEVSSAFIYDGVHSATDTQPLVSLGMLENNEPRVAAAIHTMEQHIDEPIGIADIASRTRLSVRMLEYLFRQTLNMSPAAYYRRLRLQTARRLVVDTRLQLQEIAIRTGFNSLSSFSRRFKNYYRQTPGDCRRQARAIFH